MKFPITSKFNATENFRENGHTGVDLLMSKNTELYSIQPGRISDVVNYGDVNIGKGVLVKWEDGKTAIYGHMEKITVNKGDTVKTGDLLGLSGNSGNVVGENGGYHLHFGLKDVNGRFIDPEPYVPLLQKMGDNINHIAEHSDNITKLDPSIMLQQALDGLTDMKINFISLLPEIHTISQEFHVVFLSIT